MKGCSSLRLHRADAAALLDQVVGGDAVLHAQALQVAVAQTGALALQAALGLRLRGGQRVALLDLHVEPGQALGLGGLGHCGASLRLGARPHLEPHRVALGQPLAAVPSVLAPLQLLQVRQARVVGQHLLEGREVFAAQPGVHGEGGALAAGHGVDGRLGAAQGVAGHEETGPRGAAGEPVGRQVFPADPERTRVRRRRRAQERG